MPSIPLIDLNPGQSATIFALYIDPRLQQRFCALGLRCGQEIHLLRRGWMQGPLHVRVGMTEVMLRRCDARQIAVTAVEGSA